jgi:hypothetical protein
MDKIIDGILTAVYLVLLTAGSGYTLEKIYHWTEFGRVKMRVLAV